MSRNHPYARWNSGSCPSSQFWFGCNGSDGVAVVQTSLTFLHKRHEQRGRILCPGHGRLVASSRTRAATELASSRSFLPRLREPPSTQRRPKLLTAERSRRRSARQCGRRQVGGGPAS